MNAKIEVVAAEASMAMTLVRVVSVVKGFFMEVVLTTQVATTSVLRVLSQGRSSLSAIPGDINDFINGGEAALVV